MLEKEPSIILTQFKLGKESYDLEECPDIHRKVTQGLHDITLVSYNCRHSILGVTSPFILDVKGG